MDFELELDAMRPLLRERAWGPLERRYKRACVDQDARVAAAIEAVDLMGYQARLANDLLRASEAVTTAPRIAAVYWEFDVDNKWSSNFFLCSNYRLEAAGDDEWATEFGADGVIEGPDMSDLASLYGRTWDRTLADIARNLYLVGRTVATFGRASEHAWPNPLPLCAGFHDQSIVFRIVERS
jgi:hypothetical protein